MVHNVNCRSTITCDASTSEISFFEIFFFFFDFDFFSHNKKKMF